jgi:hypothetical protein
MKQPVPSNSAEPLKVGDRVQIVPEWQDPGDEKYERHVIEAPAGCTQVRIRAQVPGLVFQSVEWIEAERLVHLPLKTEH